MPNQRKIREFVDRLKSVLSDIDEADREDWAIALTRVAEWVRKQDEKR